MTQKMLQNNSYGQDEAKYNFSNILKISIVYQNNQNRS